MKKILFIFLLNLFLLTNVFAGELARIEKISDGDTFIVRNEKNQKIKLRLIWIDTPEKFSSKKLEKDAWMCGVGKNRMIRLGKMATSYAKKYFENSKNVEVDYYGKGYYGRSLAVVYRRGATQPYNFDVIADGYACVYRKARYPQVLDELLEKAKKERRGLWSVDYEVMNCLCR
ncbi:thermonuclease family protein [Deferribacter autotrophicus]|uniref:Thermonuclease family protein n=1 Tax=Deferribacter autotrophicus TaxID=500465 RepID=A0A5A8F2B0_9BACT|nr:thermonuclease family protein [Deferribacter autotrophicus]KAA0257565.1 thermonuclease family protein [Deferribacter autotrophicus]